MGGNKLSENASWSFEKITKYDAIFLGGILSLEATNHIYASVQAYLL